MNDLVFWSQSDEGKELSNFYVVTFALPLQCGVFLFSSAEAAYQCLKQPKLSAAKVRPFQLAEPRSAREYGRSVALRDDWDNVKDTAMLHVLKHKFAVPEMRAYLQSTWGRHLVHWSPWDTYWGIGERGVGLNTLGRMLESIRVLQVS